MEKFVLLADRRSGTTLVIDCLNKLPRIRCEKRAFGIDRKVKNPTQDEHSGMFFLYRDGVWKRQLRYYLQRQSLIEDFLNDEIFIPGQPEDIRGFRLIYNKAEQHPEIIKCLKGTGTKVIHLIRQNVLKTHISYKSAPIHKMHHPRQGDTVKHVRLHLDPDTIILELGKRLHRIEAMKALVQDMPHLEIFYEEFTRDRQAQAAIIQPFLGMEEVLPFQSDLMKINPDSLEDIVENYQEIKGVLTGTEFEKFLYC